MKRDLGAVVIAAGIVAIAILVSSCAAETGIDFELPGDGGALSDDLWGDARLLGGPPSLRSPFAGSERVTSYVTHSSGGRLVDYACRRITRRNHRGTDFGVPVGTAVLAAAAGRVIRRADGCAVGASRCGGSFGNHVILLHTGGRATLYAHLRSGSGIPALGAMVGCGDRIGESGNTGRSTGPHLHFEVRDGVTGANDYFSAGALDPYGGACSSQPQALWLDGTPGPTCDGGEAAPRDDSAFVSATHPRRVRVRPGQEIVQRWTLRNTGTTTWTPSTLYQLRFVSGESFGGADPIPVASAIAPGATASFELRARAPSTGGVHRGSWRMAVGDVGVFGATVFLEVEVAVPPAPRGCRSATLGRTVADGDCVQVSYAACGAASCGWFACDDGSWQCTDGASCRGTPAPNAACTPRDLCSEIAMCGECASRSGCAWCASENRCVAAGGACDARVTSPAACSTCQPAGGVCRTDGECCDAAGGASGNVRCVVGFCTETAGCGLTGAGCTNAGECCGALTCSATGAGGQDCCHQVGDPCASSSDCCGHMQCADGQCICQERGQPCASTRECCGALLCTAGVCGT